MNTISNEDVDVLIGFCAVEFAARAQTQPESKDEWEFVRRVLEYLVCGSPLPEQDLTTIGNPDLAWPQRQVACIANVIRDLDGVVEHDNDRRIQLIRMLDKRNIFFRLR